MAGKKAWLAVLVLATACAAPGSRPTAPPPRAPEAPPLAQAVFRSARAYLPEEDGGRSAPRDAADFTAGIFGENGVRLPKTVVEQSLAGIRVAPVDLRAGDLVFFSGERVSRIAEHVGVYMEKGHFAHFRPGYGVTLERLDGAYYKERFITARRVIL